MRFFTATILAGGIATSPAAQAATTFSIHRIVLSGTTSVHATAVNGKGVIVGDESDASGEHGFILSGKTLTILPNVVPDCSATGAVYPSAINENGEVAGGDLCAGAQSATFLYQNGNYVSTASVGMGAGGSLFVGLNNSGKAVFNYYVGSGNYVPYSGFLPKTRQIAPNGRGSVVLSVNGKGVPAGFTYEGCYGGIGGGCVFVGQGDHFTNLYPADAVTASGGFINNAGQVAGTYAISYTGPYSGFVYSHGTYTIFKMPNRARTMSVFGINKFGRVIGVYSSGDHRQHGFLYNGATVSTFGAYPTTDLVGMAINARGEILVTDTAQGISTSYRVHCSGDGC